MTHIKDEKIVLRVSTKQKEQLKVISKNKKLGYSELIRKLIFEEYKKVV